MSKYATKQEVIEAIESFAANPELLIEKVYGGLKAFNASIESLAAKLSISDASDDDDSDASDDDDSDASDDDDSDASDDDDESTVDDAKMNDGPAETIAAEASTKSTEKQDWKTLGKKGAA